MRRLFPLAVALTALTALAGLIPPAARALDCTTNPGLCNLALRSFIEQPSYPYAVDIVLVGDGFTTGWATGSAWKKAANDAMNAFKNASVAGVYQALPLVYNFHVVDVISATTDVADDDTTDTALGMRAVGQDIITANNSAASLAALNAPDVDVVVIIANSIGGRANAYYPSQLAMGGSVRMPGLSSEITRVLPHELGHAIFRLADEYVESGFCTNTPTEYGFLLSPNLTADATCYKFAEVAGAGCFQGGGYCATGSWRSANNCLMRSAGNVATCPVCGQHIHDILVEKRTGRDVAEPWVITTAPVAGSTIGGSATFTARWSDGLLAGTGQVGFFVDGVYAGAAAVPWTSNANLVVDTQTLASGPHTLVATVTDAAGFSREAKPVSFTVANDGTGPAPPIRIDYPAPNATVSALTFVYVPAGTPSIDMVSLRLDGVVVAATHLQSMSWSWDTTLYPVGPHTLDAQVITEGQVVATSVPLTVNVVRAAGSTVTLYDPWPSAAMTWAAVGPWFQLRYNVYGPPGVTQLELLVDGVSVGALPPANMEIAAGLTVVGLVDARTWSLGPHEIRVRSVQGGVTKETAPRGVIRGDGAAPSAFADGLVVGPYTLSGIIEVPVVAGDASVVEASLLRAGVPVASTTTLPGTLVWDTLTATNGCAALAVQARDAAGNLRQTALGSGCVDNAPPSVSISWPPSGTTLRAGFQPVKIDVTEAGGGIVWSGEVFVDGVLAWSSNINANNAAVDLTPGQHQIIAAVTDNGGNRGVSAPRDVDVARCTNAAECNDQDACTADTCTVTGVCLHALIGACCATDADCADADPCTTDACASGACTYAVVAGCCAHGVECDDTDLCTLDVCSAVGGTCSNPGSGCCATDPECNDQNGCTTDSCVAGWCANQEAPGCCNVAADCADGNTCTSETCVAGQCQVAPIAGCCNLAADCNDGDFCTSDVCSNQVCQNTVLTTCCRADSECTTANPCGIPRCNPTSHVCDETKIAGCCTLDFECPDSDACTVDDCAGTTCTHPRIAGCCTTLADCNDQNACTTDSCVAGQCSYGSVDCSAGNGPCSVGVCAPATGCGITPTNEGGTCSDGDACTTGEACHTAACNGGADVCPDTRIIFAAESASVTVGGFAIADEDLATWDVTTHAYAFWFDGSDVGLSAAVIDALAVDAAGDVYLSFRATVSIAGLVGGPSGTNVDAHDIVRFRPTSLGATTAGSFTFVFDGSDVGLTTNAENVDALAVLADGSFVVSTQGVVSVPGVAGEQQDLLRFVPTSTGKNTAGSWSTYFDGSDVNLTLGAEDVDALAILADGSLLLSTTGAVSVTGVNAADEDVLRFVPTSLGANTAGTFTLYYDGSVWGFTDDVTALELRLFP